MLAALSAGVAGDAAGEEGVLGGACRTDRNCSGYYRCLNGLCAVPPAVIGRGDASTPIVELVADRASRGQFFVELATDRFEQSRGLSYRPSMADGWGMLFRYPAAVHHAFTMAQMRFPLDLIFIGDDGKVVDIIEDAQPKVPILVSSSAYRYVLELSAGTVHAHGIRVGDRMKLTKRIGSPLPRP